MANKEHVKILSRGVHSWNQWRNIDNAIPDLSGITMYGFNFKSLSILSPHYFEEFENNRTFFWKRRRFTSNSKREYLPDLFRIDLSGANFQDTNFQD